VAGEGLADGQVERRPEVELRLPGQVGEHPVDGRAQQLPDRRHVAPGHAVALHHGAGAQQPGDGAVAGMALQAQQRARPGSTGATGRPRVTGPLPGLPLVAGGVVVRRRHGDLPALGNGPKRDDPA
jgi:hypothetical protein